MGEQPECQGAPVCAAFRPPWSVSFAPLSPASPICKSAQVLPVQPHCITESHKIIFVKIKLTLHACLLTGPRQATLSGFFKVKSKLLNLIPLHLALHRCSSLRVKLFHLFGLRSLRLFISNSWPGFETADQKIHPA